MLAVNRAKLSELEHFFKDFISKRYVFWKIAVFNVSLKFNFLFVSLAEFIKKCYLKDLNFSGVF